MPFLYVVLLLFLLLVIRITNTENVYCTYYRESNEITCGIVTCSTEVPPNADLEKDGLDVKLPRGWYRIGVQTIRNDHSWFNLYRRKATGNGYWDFYTTIPERNCIGGFGIHSGKNMAATVTIKDPACFSKLADQIEKKSTIEKFDVHQCRKCIFHSCWLGTRILPAARQYTTNLRSY
ncbi:hypothetical protein DICVIV_05632 [Dictyocaulus viviparus]|uniref:Uncharacterized protein n=1 Tax=Dictyocaulus viviparus TaxID=29172 RepID=A0A0D8XUU8_DICVI|nr:hypothetical protein DICVIV_05632 [Dictyocaulus viviparus]